MRAVLFDLDGTLRHSQPDSFQAFLDYLAELGHTPSAAEIQAGQRWVHYYWAIAPELIQDLTELGHNTPSFWRRQTERQLMALNVSGDVPTLAQTIHASFETRYQPLHHVPPDVPATLIHLRQAGYRLGLVSNRKEALDDLVAEIGLTPYFDFVLSAGQINSWKPDPRIFQHALTLVQCQPHEVVYVGDNYYADIEGARRAGLAPVLIDPLNLFPDPGCPVIHTIDQLSQLLPTRAQ